VPWLHSSVEDKVAVHNFQRLANVVIRITSPALIFADLKYAAEFETRLIDTAERFVSIISFGLDQRLHG
jgi:hypothetical protein